MEVRKRNLGIYHRRQGGHWVGSELSKPEECIKTDLLAKTLKPLSGQVQKSVCKFAATAFGIYKIRVLVGVFAYEWNLKTLGVFGTAGCWLRDFGERVPKGWG